MSLNVGGYGVSGKLIMSPILQGFQRSIDHTSVIITVYFDANMEN